MALVFTDVEGSTELWQVDEDVFGWALVEHDHEVRECLERYAGREVKHTGDGFFLAFPDAVQAARFCLELQTRLSLTAWPEEIGAVRTRIGVHYGSPRRHGDDYRGAAVNLASRVCDASHGGQILVTGETAKALQGDADLRGRLSFLGAQELAGIRASVDLYELICDATRKLKFPPLGSGQTTSEVNPRPRPAVDDVDEMSGFTADDHAVWRRARQALRVPEHKRAIDLLLALHDRHPDNLKVLSTLGVAYAWAQQYDRAEHCFRRVVSSDSHHAASWFNLARVYGKMGRRKDIGYAIAMTLKADPNHSKAREVAAKYGVEIPRLPD